MANQEQLDILKRDVGAWKRWRQQHPHIQPDLSGANLSAVYLVEANLSGADLSGANLRRARLHGADLIGARLSEADLGGANVSGAILHRADLIKATLHNARLIKADLQYACLINANLIEASFDQASLFRANLSGADLSRASLTRTNLSGADLSRATLSGANLNDADLDGANLNGAILMDAHLFGANLLRTNLSGANLNGADLRRATLNGTTLTGIDLSNAHLWETCFAGVDLRSLKGLNTVIHDGPSTIGIDTIILSGGLLPERFLQDAGVPDSWITYSRSLVGQPIDFYSCFISYSSKDDAFARRLHADLQSHNVRCWFAPEDMKIGDRMRERIDQSIRLYDKLLLILSEQSVMSEWVEDEVEAALEKERLAREQGEERTVLFPVRLDEAVKMTTKAWAAKLRRQRHIGDFTYWKNHDEYQKAFARLLRDLKAEA